MTTYVDYIVCPLCGKTAPINNANFKPGKPEDLGLIQRRECRGKQGFCKVDEQPLRDCLEQYSFLASEIVERCSEILKCCLDLEYSIQLPRFIVEFNQLQQKLSEANRENEELCFDLAEKKSQHKLISVSYEKLEKENEKLQTNLSEMKLKQKILFKLYTDLEKEKDALTLKLSDFVHKNTLLRRDLRYSKSKKEKALFHAYDSTEEVKRLNKKIQNLKKYIKSLEGDLLR